VRNSPPLFYFSNSFIRTVHRIRSASGNAAYPIHVMMEPVYLHSQTREPVPLYGLFIRVVEKDGFEPSTLSKDLYKTLLTLYQLSYIPVKKPRS
jgi:hypothetical protein